MTKTLAKRVKSSVQTVVVMPPSTPDKELEAGMMRAREGAEALREIVEPLEEQIVALKGKLRETDSLLQEYERRRSVSLLETEAVSSWLAGGDKKAVEDKLIDMKKQAVMTQKNTQDERHFLQKMEEAALRDYKVKDVKTSRDFTAKLYNNEVRVRT